MSDDADVSDSRLARRAADDGAIITINNRVLISKRPDGSRYAFSTLDVLAPEGPHAWLNQLVLVGTRISIPREPRVLIRVFSLT
jgi:hypothetical protein